MCIFSVYVIMRSIYMLLLFFLYIKSYLKNISKKKSAHNGIINMQLLISCRLTCFVECINICVACVETLKFMTVNKQMLCICFNMSCFVSTTTFVFSSFFILLWIIHTFYYALTHWYTFYMKSFWIIHIFHIFCTKLPKSRKLFVLYTTWHATWYNATLSLRWWVCITRKELDMDPLFIIPIDSENDFAHVCPSGFLVFNLKVAIFEVI